MPSRSCRYRRCPTIRNTPIGLRGSVSPARACTDRLCHRVQRVRLADDALFHRLLQVQHSADLVRLHASGRNAGPSRDHLRHRLAIDHRKDQRRLALQVAQLRRCCCQLRPQRVLILDIRCVLDLRACLGDLAKPAPSPVPNAPRARRAPASACSRSSSRSCRRAACGSPAAISRSRIATSVSISAMRR